jgi:hypothetical protein
MLARERALGNLQMPYGSSCRPQAWNRPTVRKCCEGQNAQVDADGSVTTAPQPVRNFDRKPDLPAFDIAVKEA